MNRNLKVGLFILVALVLFMSGLFMIGNRHEVFSKHLIVYTDFKSLSGLTKGSKVQVAGMDAGRVEAILVPSSPAAKFRLKLQVNDEFHGLIRTDSLATIDTEGIVGDTFVLISPGTVADPAIQPGGELGSKEPTEIADLLGQAQSTIADVDSTVKNANGVLTSVGGNLNATLTTARGTIGDVDTVVAGIKRGDGTAGLLLRDPKTAEAVRESIANVEQATVNVQKASGQANALLADVQSRNLPQKIDATLGSTQDAMARIDNISAGIQQTVAEMTAPDQYGARAGTNLRDTISNMNAASGNLNEDAEALKRNFLMRAFFRERGYYSLDGIAPTTYRKDRIFTSPRNSRAWLTADHLFAIDKTGQMQLSADGRAAIDQAIAPYGSDIEGAAVMVEGYASSGGWADKVDVSRERALIVRSYIRDHYHLAAVDVGAIGLGSLPPNGAAHAEWNGVCVVLLKPRH